MSQRPRISLKSTLSRYLLKTNALEQIRLQLSAREALAPLVGMALITGVLAGGVTVLFRFAMEWPTTFFCPYPKITSPYRHSGGLPYR